MINEAILAIMSVSLLISFFMATFFIGIMLFLFYLYTRLAKDVYTGDIKTADSPQSIISKTSEYTPFIQHLSKRELEVIETALTGKVSYKEISSALNISVHTVKAHLKNIYKITGVSNVAALSFLFRGYCS